MNRLPTYREEGRTANKVLPQWGLTEVIEQLYYYQLLCIFSADGFQNPPLRQYPNRCTQFYEDTDFL